MFPKIWTTFNNGRFKIASMSFKTLEESLELMKNTFFKNELVSKALEVYRNPKAIEELVKLPEYAAKDGISLVTIDTKTNRVVCAGFSKILVKNQESIFEKFQQQIKEEESKAFIEFMINADQQIDIFDHHGVNSAHELLFIATNPNYRGKSIANYMTKVGLELVTSLSKGKNVKIPLDGQELSLDQIPKVVFCMTTTVKSRKLIRKFGFNPLKEVNYDDCFYKGVSLGSKIGHITKSYTMESLVL